MVIILAVALLIPLLILLFMYIEAHQNNVLDYSIRCPGLPPSFNGYTIYFISDIHYRKVSQKMLSKIQKPDIVIIGGDLTDTRVPFSKVGENLRRLKELGAPMIFVWGNHDLYVNRDMLVYILNKYHVSCVENQTYIVKKQGDMINLIGVDDATNDRDDLEAAISCASPGYRILISHNPVITEKIEAHHHIPLVISGHTHGGQIRLFGWGVREAGGIKTKPFGKLIISCGYGTTRFPLRLGARPDSLLIKLVSGG